MKKLLMTSAAAATMATFMVANAHATDLYTPPPVFEPAPVWSWTGPYAGLHVGTVDGDVDDEFISAAATPPGDTMDPNGIMGGLQAGYNFQFDSIVLGIEGDFSFGDVDDVIYPSIARMETQIDWMATIRARLGWAWDRTLFYATGGVAFTEMEMTLDVEFAPLFVQDSDKNTMTGWTVGGGVEHAWTDSISFKAEYLYADFGRKTYTFDGIVDTGDILDPVSVENRAALKTHTFRVGVNWLF